MTIRNSYDEVAEAARKEVGEAILSIMTGNIAKDVPSPERRKAIMSGAFTGAIGVYLVMLKGNPEAHVMEALMDDLTTALNVAKEILAFQAAGGIVQ